MGTTKSANNAETKKKSSAAEGTFFKRYSTFYPIHNKYANAYHVYEYVEYNCMYILVCTFRSDCLRVSSSDRINRCSFLLGMLFSLLMRVMYWTCRGGK